MPSPLCLFHSFPHLTLISSVLTHTQQIHIHTTSHTPHHSHLVHSHTHLGTVTHHQYHKCTHTSSPVSTYSYTHTHLFTSTIHTHLFTSISLFTCTPLDTLPHLFSNNIFIHTHTPLHQYQHIHQWHRQQQNSLFAVPRPNPCHGITSQHITHHTSQHHASHHILHHITQCHTTSHIIHHASSTTSHNIAQHHTTSRHNIKYTHTPIFILVYIAVNIITVFIFMQLRGRRQTFGFDFSESF